MKAKWHNMCKTPTTDEVVIYWAPCSLTDCPPYAKNYAK